MCNNAQNSCIYAQSPQFFLSFLNQSPKTTSSHSEYLTKMNCQLFFISKLCIQYNKFSSQWDSITPRMDWMGNVWSLKYKHFKTKWGQYEMDFLVPLVCYPNKVNRCLARYSPRATTTNRPTNRAPNKPAWSGPNWPKMPILGQIWSFWGKKS